MDDRWIAFEKIGNARDLGGLCTAKGRVIAAGLLIRSAALSEATAADEAVLRGKYRLAMIVDLRTEAERREKPDVTVAGAAYRHIPVFDGAAVGISHEKRGMDALFTVMPKLEALYRRMVTDPACRENLGRAARSVMEHDFSSGSVLWHCTEGKDRCGLLSAVLLMALGAERDTIMEDYLLTNRVNAAKAEQYRRMVLAAGRTEAEAETVRDVFLAKEAYLDAAFSAIDAQYGGTDAFLRDGLGIRQELTERFRGSVLR